MKYWKYWWLIWGASVNFGLNGGILWAQEIIVQNTEGKTLETVYLKKITVQGSTIFDDSDFQEITASYINKTVTYEDLIEIEDRLSGLYHQQGYETSSVYLPAQDIKNGIVIYEVIEGQLKDINIQGLSHLQENYVRSRIASKVTIPLSKESLEEALLLLQQDPRIEKIEANFNPGVIIGESSLEIKVSETQRWRFGLQGDNYDNPQIGGEGGVAIEFTNNNITGWGDQLELDYKVTESDGLNKLFVRYAVPVNANDGLFQVYYRDEDTRIIEAPLEEIGFKTKSSTISLGFNQPIDKRANREINLGIELSLRESSSFVFDDIPFPVFNGSNYLNLPILRLNQSYLSRSETISFGFSSQFSMGLGILHPSPPSSLLNTEFFSWRGQTQLAKKISEDLLFVARGQWQMTPDSLPSIEQFGIGGVGTVRGYRQNTRFGDNGIALSFEFPYKIVKNSSVGEVDLIPFFDIGSTENNKLQTNFPNTLASIGLSTQWQFCQNCLIKIDYGIPLTEVNDFNKTLQDEGFHFLIRIGTQF